MGAYPWLAAAGDLLRPHIVGEGDETVECGAAHPQAPAGEEVQPTPAALIFHRLNRSHVETQRRLCLRDPDHNRDDGGGDCGSGERQLSGQVQVGQDPTSHDGLNSFFEIGAGHSRRAGERRFQVNLHTFRIPLA